MRQHASSGRLGFRLPAPRRTRPPPHYQLLILMNPATSGSSTTEYDAVRRERDHAGPKTGLGLWMKPMRIILRTVSSGRLLYRADYRRPPGALA